MSDLLQSAARALAFGETAKAERYLAAHNRVQRAFGKPESAMPAPLHDLPDGLIWADASKVTPRQFVRHVLHGEPLCEVRGDPFLNRRVA